MNIDITKITRIEITEKVQGIVYNSYNINIDEVSIQDEGKTLKLFTRRIDND